MIQVFVLLIICTILAYIYNFGIVTETTVGPDGRLKKQENITDLAKLAFFVLLVIMVCYAGLRTQMNDTVVYAINFEKKTPESLSAIKNIDWSMGHNPIFNIYCIIIKSCVSRSANVFLFITSAIVISSNLLFLRKYSENFGFSIYIFIAFTTYNFTMGAMKQTLATAIVIWVIPLFLKGKKIRAAVIILAAMFIHPYVFIYLALFFLSGNIWDRKTVFIITGTILVGVFFSAFIEQVLGMLSSIGDEYETSWFEEGGVNIFRLLFYYITPFLSFVFREKIREENSGFLNLCVNLSVISACFMTMASFGGANMFGRMANYFDIITCLTLPMIINRGIATQKDKKTVTVVLILCFAYFYYTFYKKYRGYASNPLTGDFYAHISIFKLLGNW